MEYKYLPTDLAASWKALMNQGDAFVNRPLPTTTAVPSTATTTTTTKRKFVVAATQLTGAGLRPSDILGFCDRAEHAVAQAATQHGAQLILLPELWSGPYFCQTQEAALLELATPLDESILAPSTTASSSETKTTAPSKNILVARMQRLAKHFRVVLPLSIFERANNVLYNSLVVIDADGSVVGHYRKSHIPDGPGYQEKFYFSPGDTGFRVFDTTVGKIGVAICWDQWFPEAARCLALQGCEVLLYPTAIGSEPQDPTINSADHWQRVMQGHAAANMVPVVASNRFGTEILLTNKKRKAAATDGEDDQEERQRIHFYGRSFVTDETGARVAECQSQEMSTDSKNDMTSAIGIVTHEIDPETNRQTRAAWGLFRDRRPELYAPTILTKDGANNPMK